MAMWIVYVLACRDGTLYTGITNDLAKRVAAHDAGKGARYTRGRGPVKVIYVERKRQKGTALAREAAIKRLGTAAKRRLVETGGAKAARAKRKGKGA